MIAGLLSLVAAAVFVAVGVWGRRNAADLVPASFSAPGRDKRARSLRRGAVSCTVAGVLFAVAGLLTAVTQLFGE